jgi:hypothetical protein
MILDLVGNFMNLAAKSHVKVSSTVDTWSWTLKAPHGGKMALYLKEIIHTPTNAAHNHIVAAIPDGACVLALTGRVLTACAVEHDRTTLQFYVGSESGTVFGTITAAADHSIAVGSTFSATTAAAVSPIQVAADTDITLVASGGASGSIAAGGTIKIHAWYYLATAPTS